MSGAVQEENMCVWKWCNITVVSEGVKTLSTSIQSSVQSLAKQVLWIVSALGTNRWPLSLTPFLFGVVCAAEVRYSQFVLCYYAMFFQTSPSPFSLSVKSCSRWGDRAQHAATGSPGNMRPPSKNMFWPSVPHLEGYLLLKPLFPAATWHNALDRIYFDPLK